MNERDLQVLKHLQSTNREYCYKQYISKATGIPRRSLDRVLEGLRHSGLIEMGPKSNLGLRIYALTDRGAKALGDVNAIGPAVVGVTGGIRKSVKDLIRLREKRDTLLRKAGIYEEVSLLNATINEIVESLPE